MMEDESWERTKDDQERFVTAIDDKWKAPPTARWSKSEERTGGRHELHRYM
jgi:hypothetical protein